MIAKVAGVLPKVTLSNPSRSVSPLLIDVRALNRFNRSADCRPTSSALLLYFESPWRRPQEEAQQRHRSSMGCSCVISPTLHSTLPPSRKKVDSVTRCALRHAKLSLTSAPDDFTLELDA